MAIDTRLKRQSATCILLPFMLSSAPPDTAGVVQAEWQAMAWMYSGITAGAAVVGTVTRKALMLLGVGK
jgi:hypothetical protein